MVGRNEGFWLAFFNAFLVVVGLGVVVVVVVVVVVGCSK